MAHSAINIPTMNRVLLIEDDESMRRVLEQSLEQAGYAVTAVVDGGVGLRSFRAQPADLVITDLVMPGEEGISIIIRLREEFPNTPIIAISGSTVRAPQYLGMALKLGATRGLEKPFTRETLLAIVHELLAKVSV